MNGPQFDEYAVPVDLADAVTTQDEDLGQPGGRHRRPTEPRFGQARGRVEAVAVSAAVLTLVLLGITHGSPGSANSGAPVADVATAPADTSRGVVACVIARNWPATEAPAGADHGSRHTGAARTELPSCPTEEWRAAQSAYLAQLSARQASAHAGPAATPRALGPLQ